LLIVSAYQFGPNRSRYSCEQRNARTEPALAHREKIRIASITDKLDLVDDQRRRVSIFVMHLGVLPADPISVVSVTGRDDEGKSYSLPVESVSSPPGVSDASQIVVRLPDNMIGAPRDLWLKVMVRERISSEAFIKIAAP
jgi:hypothetical protein